MGIMNEHEKKEKPRLKVEGTVTHTSENERPSGGLKYGIRLDDPDYENCWLNGYGHNPFKEGDFAQVEVEFNDPWYNIIKIEGPAGEIQQAKDIPDKVIEQQARLSAPDFKLWRETVLETNRANILCQAVQFAIKCNFESTEAVWTLYDQMMKKANQTEIIKKEDENGRTDSTNN